MSQLWTALIAADPAHHCEPTLGPLVAIIPVHNYSKSIRSKNCVISCRHRNCLQSHAHMYLSSIYASTREIAHNYNMQTLDIDISCMKAGILKIDNCM